ncbi:hypothetical protein chiPu_0013468 [Chiloscyllium punctatum]|uniref:Selenoprotein P N-terminal domain-containing protein n=1 Tax=Chiloscyllium punctatum TaxID=137246 RepID=A0A401SX94_CHIPU|nr:hypothetical protein [Chiloscyllium punctatum]
MPERNRKTKTTPKALSINAKRAGCCPDSLPAPGGASSLTVLQQKLRENGFVNISIIVLNHHGKASREKYQLLKSKVENQIPVYQQDVDQADVWDLLQGKKDDFLIYDSCGQLTYHLELPFTILTQPYVTYAIIKTYCQRICSNCSFVQDNSPECIARNITTSGSSKLHREHHHLHQNRRSNVYRNDQLRKNRTDATQLGHNTHKHPQSHYHPHHLHDQVDAESDTHDLAADNGSPQL